MSLLVPIIVISVLACIEIFIVELIKIDIYRVVTFLCYQTGATISSALSPPTIGNLQMILAALYS